MTYGVCVFSRKRTWNASHALTLALHGIGTAHLPHLPKPFDWHFFKRFGMPRMSFCK